MKFTCGYCGTSYERQADAEACELKCKKEKEYREALEAQLEPRMKAINEEVLNIEDTYGVKITFAFLPDMGDRPVLVAHKPVSNDGFVFTPTYKEENNELDNTPKPVETPKTQNGDALFEATIECDDPNAVFIDDLKEEA